MTTKDESGKNIFELEKGKRLLEEQVNNLTTQVEELEDALQLAEDAKLRAEVQLSALRRETDEAAQQIEQDSEEKRRVQQKQLREFETQLDKERAEKVIFQCLPF